MRGARHRRQRRGVLTRRCNRRSFVLVGGVHGDDARDAYDDAYDDAVDRDVGPERDAEAWDDDDDDDTNDTDDEREEGVVSSVTVTVTVVVWCAETRARRCGYQ